MPPEKGFFRQSLDYHRGSAIGLKIYAPGTDSLTLMVRLPGILAKNALTAKEGQTQSAECFSRRIVPAENR